MSTLSRRTFIKYFAIGVSSYVCPRTRQGSALNAEIVPSDLLAGSVKLNVSDYPQLANAGGSVLFKWQRFRFEDNGGMSPFSTGGPDPFIVTRLASSPHFTVFNSACRHAGCTVFPFSFTGEVTNGYYRCQCHGALYTLTGEPALDYPPLAPGEAYSALETYPFTYDGNDQIVVEVPNFAFQVSMAPVQTSADRLRLDFNSFFSVKYSVLFRPEAGTEWQPVTFAHSDESPEAGETEPLVLTEFESLNFNETVWVAKPATRGIFAIQALVTTGHPLQS